MSQLDTGSLDNFKELMAKGKIFGSDLSLRKLQDSLRYIPFYGNIHVYYIRSPRGPQSP